MIYDADHAAGFALFNRCSAREPEALAEVAELFPPDSDCFACGAPVGAAPGLFVTGDPSQHRVVAVLAPLCTDCMALPPVYRAAKLTKMMRSMWGKRVGHNLRMVSARPLSA